MNIKIEIKKIENEIIKWRRDLHSIPEVGLQLPETLKYVTGKLKEMGIEYYTLDSCSGIVGIIRGKENGKTIAIRADMDAFPVKEETGLFYASQDGNMHACGHEAHAAMLLGAAKVLSKIDDFKGNIKLIFEPGEEKCEGSTLMINEGVLKNPDVDAMIGLHIGNFFRDIPNGNIGIKSGPIMSGRDRFIVKIKGRGCHGAFPGFSIDPITITSQIIVSLQTIISREINATDAATISICRISGGEVYNIISNEVEFEGVIVSQNNKVREKVIKRVEEIIEGISKTLRAECVINFTETLPILENNDNITEYVKKAANKILEREYISDIKVPALAGEDVANFFQKVPGCFFYLSSYPEGDKIYSHHNCRFDINENDLWKGSAIFVQSTLDFLK
jgi:amidohydrolase